MTKERRSFSLRRRAEFKELAPLLLVVCEGKTEAHCVKGLLAEWRVPAVRVEVLGQQGVPKTIVEKALERRSDFKESERPEVWVVFDRDEHESWAAAIDRAHALGFKLAVSNPCFELWGILLYRDQTALIHRHIAQSLLSELHPSYHHDRSPTLNVRSILTHLNGCSKRIQRLTPIWRERGQYANPSTTFDDLVQRLQGLAV